jgi:hypothetical protein
MYEPMSPARCRYRKTRHESRYSNPACRADGAILHTEHMSMHEPEDNRSGGLRQQDCRRQ